MVSHPDTDELEQFEAAASNASDIETVNRATTYQDKWRKKRDNQKTLTSELAVVHVTDLHL